MSAKLLSLLPSGVLTVTRAYAIRYANAAAEDFLGESLPVLRGRELAHFLFPVNHILTLIDAAFAQNSLIKEYDVALAGPKVGPRHVNLQIQPLDGGKLALMVLDDRGMTDKLGQHLLQRESARSTSAMASILAHEVKNPLSGIRGAAQLLHETVAPADRELTALICNEVDRIRDVIDEIEIFSNQSEIKSEPVNIHEILQYVRLLAEKGVAGHVRFVEQYDPSLPDVAGHRGMLIQLFLNMVKNAAEALAGTPAPSITLATSYRRGFRLASAGGSERHALPIVVTVTDNGPGIAAELRGGIFDPFVTTKASGKGLGLAIASKIIADHGGVIELEGGAQQGTSFKILLPAAG